LKQFMISYEKYPKVRFLVNLIKFQSLQEHSFVDLAVRRYENNHHYRCVEKHHIGRGLKNQRQEQVR
jgi:hypothetical protein